jgi:putative transcriptional regulator
MNNRVRILRRNKHWSQDKLAARVGVSRHCIDAMEKERFLPSIALAYKIAFQLETSIFEAFPPEGQVSWPSPRSSCLRSERPLQLSSESPLQPGGLK